jgi:hypothetical protein
MKQQSCWGVLWFFKRPQVRLPKRQRNQQHDIWCLITNNWVNTVAIVSSVFIKIFNPCTYWMVTTQPFVHMFSESVFVSIRCQFSVIVYLLFDFICFFCALIHFVQLFSVQLFVYSVYFSVLIMELYSRYFNPYFTSTNNHLKVNKHHTSDSAIFCLSIGSESLSLS